MPSFAEAFQVWLRIGLLSCSGPAGQIALLHREVVGERRWIGERRFLHALNFCTLLPGPEAQQLATYLGWLMVGCGAGWLPGCCSSYPAQPEMLAGLGLAETTPGPLILVLQFVGFLAGHRAPGMLTGVPGGIAASVLTLWVTLASCFAFVFLGAPLVERLQANRALSGALAAITAAVLGVVANLALWFALRVLFHELRPISLGPLAVELPCQRASILSPWHSLFWLPCACSGSSWASCAFWAPPPLPVSSYIVRE